MKFNDILEFWGVNEGGGCWQAISKLSNCCLLSEEDVLKINFYKSDIEIYFKSTH